MGGQAFRGLGGAATTPRSAVPVKALTVQQPWAWAIFRGKNIENRTQLWKYRGPLAIHAGLCESERGLDDRRIRYQTSLNGIIGPLHFGKIIGVVDLVDVHPNTGCCRPWGESGRVAAHLVLEHQRELPEPIPCRGALGLWTPPADVLERLEMAGC